MPSPVSDVPIPPLVATAIKNAAVKPFNNKKWISARRGLDYWIGRKRISSQYQINRFQNIRTSGQVHLYIFFSRSAFGRAGWSDLGAWRQYWRLSMLFRHGQFWEWTYLANSAMRMNECLCSRLELLFPILMSKYFYIYIFMKTYIYTGKSLLT